MDPLTTLTTAVVAFLAQGAVADQPGEPVVAALEALADFKSTPEDPDAQAALRHQLKKALAAAPVFQAELARLLEEAKAESTAATYQADLKGPGAIAQGEGAVAAGARGVAIGGSVSGSAIVTGDSNTVGQPEKDRQR